MKPLFASFVLVASIAGCAADKSELDATTIDAIDINEGKADSLRFPTVMGSVAMDASATGKITPAKAYHAYDFTYDGAPGTLQLDARSPAGRDLVLAAYRRTGTSWKLQAWNDDCDDSTLNSCLALPSTAGQYRFVVTTYGALVGSPGVATYSFAIGCAGGGCQSQGCGGLAGLQCGTGEYCAYALDATCGAADQMGTCEPMPQFCTEQYDPVCGCDGQTYGNECFAASAGVSVSAPGACEVACGARAGDTCTADQFCKFSRAAICGQADGQGVCESRPEICTANFAQVCGCDGQTYSNECNANVAGTGVLHDGPCT